MTLVLSAFLMVVMLGVVALAVDIGYIVLVRTQLQVAADSAVMAAATAMNKTEADVIAVAQKYAGYHAAGGTPVEPQNTVVEFGVWDSTARTFQPTASISNAVRVTTRRPDTAYFFGRIFGLKSFTAEASAISMANPREIAFVVDLSGSMNDDTEPAWATSSINGKFGPQGFGNVGNQLMQDLFSDFGFGAYPGQTAYIGQGLSGVTQNQNAYAQMTRNSGPLTQSTVPATYRIASTDSEAVRKQKAYGWIIDNQLAVVMPSAKPKPASSTNYAYWAKYLDYVIESARNNRGTLPPSQGSELIDGFNNPNRQTFPSASSNLPRSWRNRVGYLTYVQFMMDYGRDFQPAGNQFTPLSRSSPLCPYHYESTPGGTFNFPPRAQPEHAARRSIIAAMQVVKERNELIPDPANRDWVSIITYDSLQNGGPVVAQPLTGDYDAAMQTCTTLQAVGDKYASTATEAGLDLGARHIAPKSEGGQGRKSTNKVVVLLTDGVPNLYISSDSTIDGYLDDKPSDDYYGRGEYAYDASLMQAAKMQARRWQMFPVGLGLGTDYDFMDRLSRLGGTANDAGQSPRGSGNPAEYEQRLTDIFKEIITSPQVRLVQ